MNARADSTLRIIGGGKVLVIMECQRGSESSARL